MDAHTLLSELVACGTNAIAMPQRNEADQIAALRETVAREYLKPAPDGRLVNCEDMLLADVLGMLTAARADRDTPRAGLLLQVIGVLLPKVQANLYAAIRQRRGGD